jgi:hypothetical protein
MLVVIGTDCIGSYKYKYHTITARMAPIYLEASHKSKLTIIRYYEKIEMDWYQFKYFVICIFHFLRRIDCSYHHYNCRNRIVVGFITTHAINAYHL